VPDEQAAALESALGRLGIDGLTIVVERSGEPPAPVPGARDLRIELVGLDRPGLVHEVSALLASHGVNVEELATDRVAAAHSGDLLFRAEIRVGLPATVDAATIRRGLERIADDMMVEIRLAEPSI
jgi:glycine cleavage system regulatory protein